MHTNYHWQLKTPWCVQVLLAASLTWMCSANSAELKACIPDYQSDPISSPGAESQGQRTVASAVRRQGDTVRFLAAPWARCIAGIASAQYDLIVGVEADETLQQTIAFPEKSGRPDSTRRLGAVEYVLVRKSTAATDHKPNHVHESAIVPTSGYAVAKRLSMSGALTKTMNYDAGRFISLLCHDRADMIVLRRGDMASVLGECEPQHTFVLQLSSMGATDVYLGVRRSMLQSRPEFAETLWREIEKSNRNEEVETR